MVLSKCTLLLNILICTTSQRNSIFFSFDCPAIANVDEIAFAGSEMTRNPASTNKKDLRCMIKPKRLGDNYIQETMAFPVP